MQIDGKTSYSLEEAAEQTGYVKATITQYLYSGIIDGFRMEDGTWALTEAGMIALKRRKLATGSKVQKTQHKPIPEVNPAPTSSRDGALYILTDEDKEAYEDLKRFGDLLNKRVGDMSMAAVRYYVKNVLPGITKKAKDLEEEMNNLLTGMA